MNRFGLVRLPTLDAARAHVRDAPTARVFRAGGIDLFDRMKEGLDAPEQLVELRAIGDEQGARMRDIRVAEGGGHAIGALVTLAEIEDFEDLPPGHRALRQAAGSATTPGIRNAATLGGNLLQRPRCWYFRHADLVCLKKGGSVCYAVSGQNRLHAIFGGGPSHIVHPSSLAPALLALDARVVVAGTDGTNRTMPIAELFQLPSEDPTKEHTLAPGEVVVAVELPAAPAEQRSSYQAAKEKLSHDWPLAEAAVRVVVREGRMQDVRVAFGHVAPVPWRSKAAEQALEGKAPDPEVFASAATAAVADARPLSDNGYKVPLSQGMLRHALHEATDVPLPE